MNLQSLSSMFKLVDNYVVLLFSFNGLLDHYFLNILVTQSEQNSKKRKSKVSLEKNLLSDCISRHLSSIISKIQVFCVFLFFSTNRMKNFRFKLALDTFFTALSLHLFLLQNNFKILARNYNLMLFTI